jgi:hypothetical protein
MVEDEHEVGLDERRGRRPHGIRLGQRHGRLEDRHRVVRQRSHGTTGEARHVLGRLDATAADERAERLERIRRVLRPDRQLRVVPLDRHRAILDSRPPVADLEQLPRADPEERIAAEPLAALHRLQQVRGRRAIVEPQERADRGLEVRGARGTQEQRVGVRGEPLRLGEAERVGAGHVRRLPVRPNQNDLPSSGTKGRAFRGATLIRRCRTLVTDGS